jgi:AbrB family looped-hinge helix DNA binding protein
VIITVRAKGQITLPESIRTAADLKEGQRFRVEVLDDGSIVLTPVIEIDRARWIAAGKGE